MLLVSVNSLNKYKEYVMNVLEYENIQMLVLRKTIT